MFEEFIKCIGKRLEQTLPGEKAQHKMAPVGRKPMSQYLDKSPNAKRSAILILLYPHEGKVHTVFILRPAYDGNHSGQVAFPGGKFEARDLTLEKAALRETEEEIGVLANEVKVLGKLTALYIPVSNFMVHPFVGTVSAKPQFLINPKEVEKIIETELEELFEDTIVKEKKILFSSLNREISAPYFDIKGHTVWGATAMIISELKEIVKEIEK